MLVANVLPAGVRGHRRRRSAGGVDEFAGGCIQRLGDPVHDGLLLANSGPTSPSTSWSGSARCHRVMVLIGLAWIPVIQGGKGLYDYLQGVQAYLAPPIFVVFFLGVFWKRLNGAGMLCAALIVGIHHGAVPAGDRHAGQADRRLQLTRKARSSGS